MHFSCLGILMRIFRFLEMRTSAIQTSQDKKIEANSSVQTTKDSVTECPKKEE